VTNAPWLRPLLGPAQTLPPAICRRHGRAGGAPGLRRLTAGRFAGPARDLPETGPRIRRTPVKAEGRVGAWAQAPMPLAICGADICWSV